MIDTQELADAVACPARDKPSRCQDAGYCYPKICRHRLKALNLNQDLNQEEHDTDADASAQLEFVLT
jgi:hypothetical protein